MIKSFAQTLDSSARAEDTLFPLREFFLDPDSHRIRYVAVDAGSWFDSVEVLVASRLLRAIEEEPGWVLDLTPEAVESAPVWKHEGETSNPLAVEHWPPVVIGPFGHTAAPLMIWAQMAAAAQETQPPHPPAEDAISEDAAQAQAPAPQVDALDRASEWIGKPVFASDGEMGILADFGFDPDSMIVSHLVVDNDKLLSSRRAVFPISALRHRAGASGHFVLDVRLADMENAPTPDEAGLGPQGGYPGYFAPI